MNNKREVIIIVFKKNMIINIYFKNVLDMLSKKISVFMYIVLN